MNAQAQRLSTTPPPLTALVGALAGAAGAGLLVGVLGGSPVLAFAAIVALFVGAVAIVRQDLVVGLVLFVIYTDAAVVAVDSQGLPFALAAAVPLLLAVPLAHRFLSYEPLIGDSILLLLVGLLLVMGLSALLARDAAVALDGIKTFALQGVLLYVLLLNVLHGRRALSIALWTVLAAAAFIALVSIVQYLTKSFDRPFFGFASLDGAYLSGQTSEPRAGGPVGDPNYFAQLLLPALAFAMVAVMRERTLRLRLAAAAMGALIIFAIILTGSRGGAVALAAMIGAMLALRLLGPAQLVSMLAVVVIALALNPGYVQRLGDTSLSGIGAPSGTTVEADSAARGRFTENLAAAKVFADHPLVGVGPGGFPLYYQEYAARIGIEVHERERSGPDSGQAPEREAHNIVLGLAADLGVIGLGLFLAVVWLAFAGLRRARRRWLAERQPGLADIAGALIVGLTGYLVAGLFLSLAYERYLWLLLAIVGATIALSKAPVDARV